jgi:hypothetical protein
VQILALFDSLITHYDAYAQKPPESMIYRRSEMDIDQILKSVYKWIIGSGRVIWITDKIKSCYIKEGHKESPYYLLEAWNKEYRNLVQLYNARGTAIEIYFFGKDIILPDIHPICSITGGRMHYFPGVDLENYWNKLYFQIKESLSINSARLCNSSIRAPLEFLNRKWLTPHGEVTNMLVEFNRVDEKSTYLYKFSIDK